MTGVGGVLLLLDGAPHNRMLATTTAIVRGATDVRPDSVAPSSAPFDRERWSAIVIHHSGLPAGNGASIERHQQAAGISGLGYHFVIGNGHGLGDGEVQVGYRWAQQRPGAHVAVLPRLGTGTGARPVSLSASALGDMNERSIGICLVGNGDRTAFSPRQIHELVALVRSLQRELGIPATEVYLHRDLAEVTSPGERFPTSEFESQLLR